MKKPTNCSSIGIFGGSFDPFHEGHLHVIREVARLSLFSKLLLIPNFCSPFKEHPLYSTENRLEMIRHQMRIFPKCMEYELCEWEINQNRPCPSIDTVTHLKSLMPETTLYWVLGSDSFFSVHTWHSSTAFLSQVTLVVVRRDNKSRTDYLDYAKSVLGVTVIMTGDQVVEVSSTEIKKNLDPGLIL